MFIDSHLHFNNEKYKEAGLVVSDMINRAKILGVEKFITISTKTSEFEEITQISEEFPEVYHTLGIYPTEDFGMKLNDLENLIINHINKKTVAIGECGFNQPLEENDRNIKSQRSLFEMQLDLATRRNLPIVIHNRNSDVETLESLNEFKNKNLRGVIHCFVSDYAFAKKALDLGLYLSFNGITTYKTATNLHETIKNMPLDRMILETDAPYLTPDKFRSELNEPKFIPLIAEKISEIRGVDLNIIEEATYQNTLKLFDKIK
jgi:TatD DNase family protein